MIGTTHNKLDPEAQFKPTSEALEAILGAFGMRLTSFQIAPSGIENMTMSVITDKGHFALRVYRQNFKTRAGILPELGFMDYLRGEGVPTPEIIPGLHGEPLVEYKDKDLTWFCILMQWMPGEHPKEYTAHLLRDMATLQAKMHTLGAQFANSRTDLRRQFEDNRLVSKGLLRHVDASKVTDAAVNDFLKRVEVFAISLPAHLPRGFNHLDYDHANILATGDKVSAVLDFDDVSLSPIAICLGYTLWDIISVTKSLEKVKEYVGHYIAVRQLHKDELAILKDVMLFRNYIVACIQFAFWGEDAKRLRPRLEMDAMIQKLNVSDFA